MAGISKSKQLRDLLTSNSLLVAPGCHDGISAKMVQQAGFNAAYMTGFGVSASLLGMPDTGLITFSQMCGQAGHLAGILNIPLIADADTGYGNAINMYHTVRAYAKAGVAGIQIEDQVAPKRCGHTAGKAVVSIEEMVGKVRAAKAAQEEKDIVLIVRTDARAVNGFDDALERCLAYEAAGADVLFFEAPESETEMETLCKKIKGHKLVNVIEGGATPCLPASRLQAMGFSVAIYPVLLLSAAAKAMQNELQQFGPEATFQPTNTRIDFEEIKSLVGFDEYAAMSERFAR